MNRYRIDYKRVRGQFRLALPFLIVATQAANSRLFTIRNPAADRLVIIDRLNLGLVQTSTFTAAILVDLAVVKHTAFTVEDTTNSTPHTPARLNSDFDAPIATPRSVTTGHANGMTGGTISNTGTLGRTGLMMATAVPTTQQNGIPFEVLGSEDNPLVLKQNEGLGILNTTLLGAAAGAAVFLNLSWTEVEL